jgi:hypothetical protein
MTAHTVILSAAKDLASNVKAPWHWRSMPDPSEYLRMTLLLLSDMVPPFYSSILVINTGVLQVGLEVFLLLVVLFLEAGDFALQAFDGGFLIV